MSDWTQNENGHWEKDCGVLLLVVEPSRDTDFPGLDWHVDSRYDSLIVLGGHDSLEGAKQFAEEAAYERVLRTLEDLGISPSQVMQDLTDRKLTP
jgi:hypothetical protein